MEKSASRSVTPPKKSLYFVSASKIYFRPKFQGGNKKLPLQLSLQFAAGCSRPPDESFTPPPVKEPQIYKQLRTSRLGWPLRSLFLVFLLPFFARLSVFFPFLFTFLHLLSNLKILNIKLARI